MEQAAEQEDFLIGKASYEWANKARLACCYESQVTSTNLIAKENAAQELEAIKLYFADFQTAGKGRGQNQWNSLGSGDSLLCSWSFALSKNPQPTVSPLLGLALYRSALASWPSLKWSLKAPNDLFLGDRKIAGILIEVISEGPRTRLIFGLGFNVFSHPELASATCLEAALKQQGLSLSVADWCQFLDRLLLELTMALSGMKKELEPNQQVSLCFALNQNPLLNEKFLRVEENGNLVKPSRILRWSEL